MKTIRLIICLLAGLFQIISFSAKAESFPLTVYIGEHGAYTQVEFILDVVTSEGAYHGEYYQDGKALLVRPVPNRVWTGPGNVPAPTLEVTGGSHNANDSDCPGINALSGGWGCDSLPVKFTISGEATGCPWLVTVRVISHSSTMSPETYTGPQTPVSTCPAQSLTPYDISWDQNYVVKNKVIRLQSTGGMIEKTLPTFLMKDGKLCDGGQASDESAYCRFVTQMLTFSSSGCDNGKVTVTPNRHPITDKEVHDMVVHVDTTERQPIDSTCRFTYVLNMF
ncbi:TPA: DUF2544 domain-containing protein [Escherichia coli]|uniref:StfH/YfcO family fimbrial adhesin n=1 Tax=Escherichia coli TaxID=562 RepID=UPI001BE19E59|nr:StfH/YfcO family fimbrial adhesin [Escherichia coli]EEY9436883.1 DUF2544 domain-containing protein [Escherichia coli]EHY6208789.1 DUF2544 domain-containing protein [Escherichia coli]MDN0935054.1 DUF2544 domain-containing protein [Escherichia coli]UBU38477.1 YfcO family protein [Escherichia coli O78]HBD3064750.1 DUF2544 domain-containing protein [Escherichia coli]